MGTFTQNINFGVLGKFWLGSFIDCSVDVENQVYEMDIDIPALRIEAEYSMDGKLLLMPIKGNGDMTANVSK